MHPITKTSPHNYPKPSPPPLQLQHTPSTQNLNPAHVSSSSQNCPSYIHPISYTPIIHHNLLTSSSHPPVATSVHAHPPQPIFAQHQIHHYPLPDPSSSPIFPQPSNCNHNNQPPPHKKSFDSFIFDDDDDSSHLLHSYPQYSEHSHHHHHHQNNLVTPPHLSSFPQHPHKHTDPLPIQTHPKIHKPHQHPPQSLPTHSSSSPLDLPGPSFQVQKPVSTIAPSASSSSSTKSRSLTDIPDNSSPPKQLDFNGRPVKNWKGRWYKCSHCDRKFLHSELHLYALHIQTLEAKYGVAKINRTYKCLEPSCEWSKIGFTRKLEFKKHFARMHSIPQIECPFWRPDNQEAYPNANKCSTRWHTDTGSLKRHLEKAHNVTAQFTN